eukprot:TRINITY_DN5722_c0_g1_i6.p1 TRINITY_DN5722_c0_g1~~TRINITY_DN5722_c0_g1_i6.p1  ORF type:complete len:1671 (-),score=252.76 TRINITY_DN5722_c0_g1_i6:436-5448(-)
MILLYVVVVGALGSSDSKLPRSSETVNTTLSSGLASILQRKKDHDAKRGRPSRPSSSRHSSGPEGRITMRIKSFSENASSQQRVKLPPHDLKHKTHQGKQHQKLGKQTLPKRMCCSKMQPFGDKSIPRPPSASGPNSRSCPARLADFGDKIPQDYRAKQGGGIPGKTSRRQRPKAPPHSSKQKAQHGQPRQKHGKRNQPKLVRHTEIQRFRGKLAARPRPKSMAKSPAPSGKADRDRRAARSKSVAGAAKGFPDQKGKKKTLAAVRNRLVKLESEVRRMRSFIETNTKATSSKGPEGVVLRRDRQGLAMKASKTAQAVKSTKTGQAMESIRTEQAVKDTTPAQVGKDVKTGQSTKTTKPGQIVKGTTTRSVLKGIKTVVGLRHVKTGQAVKRVKAGQAMESIKSEQAVNGTTPAQVVNSVKTGQSTKTIKPGQTAKVTTTGPVLKGTKTVVGVKHVKIGQAGKGVKAGQAMESIKAEQTVKDTTPAQEVKGVKTGQSTKTIKPGQTVKGTTTAPVLKGIKAVVGVKNVKTGQAVKGVKVGQAVKGIKTGQTVKNVKLKSGEVVALDVIDMPSLAFALSGFKLKKHDRKVAKALTAIASKLSAVAKKAKARCRFGKGSASARGDEDSLKSNKTSTDNESEDVGGVAEVGDGIGNNSVYEIGEDADDIFVPSEEGAPSQMRSLLEGMFSELLVMVPLGVVFFGVLKRKPKLEGRGRSSQQPFFEATAGANVAAGVAASIAAGASEAAAAADRAASTFDSRRTGRGSSSIRSWSPAVTAPTPQDRRSGSAPPQRNSAEAQSRVDAIQNFGSEATASLNDLASSHLPALQSGDGSVREFQSLSSEPRCLSVSAPWLVPSPPPGLFPVENLPCGQQPVAALSDNVTHELSSEPRVLSSLSLFPVGNIGGEGDVQETNVLNGGAGTPQLQFDRLNRLTLGLPVDMGFGSMSDGHTCHQPPHGLECMVPPPLFPIDSTSEVGAANLVAIVPSVVEAAESLGIGDVSDEGSIGCVNAGVAFQDDITVDAKPADSTTEALLVVSRRVNSDLSVVAECSSPEQSPLEAVGDPIAGRIPEMLEHDVPEIQDSPSSSAQDGATEVVEGGVQAAAEVAEVLRQEKDSKSRFWKTTLRQKLSGVGFGVFRRSATFAQSTAASPPPATSAKTRETISESSTAVVESEFGEIEASRETGHPNVLGVRRFALLWKRLRHDAVYGDNKGASEPSETRDLPSTRRQPPKRGNGRTRQTRHSVAHDGPASSGGMISWLPRLIAARLQWAALAMIIGMLFFNVGETAVDKIELALSTRAPWAGKALQLCVQLVRVCHPSSWPTPQRQRRRKRFSRTRDQPSPPESSPSRKSNEEGLRRVRERPQTSRLQLECSTMQPSFLCNASSETGGGSLAQRLGLTRNPEECSTKCRAADPRGVQNGCCGRREDGFCWYFPGATATCCLPSTFSSAMCKIVAEHGKLGMDKVGSPNRKKSKLPVHKVGTANRKKSKLAVHKASSVSASPSSSPPSSSHIVRTLTEVVPSAHYVAMASWSETLKADDASFSWAWPSGLSDDARDASEPIATTTPHRGGSGSREGRRAQSKIKSQSSSKSRTGKLSLKAYERLFPEAVSGKIGKNDQPSQSRGSFAALTLLPSLRVKEPPMCSRFGLGQGPIIDPRLRGLIREDYCPLRR